MDGDRLEDQQKLQLSLHYDTLLWTVAGILTSALGGLLVFTAASPGIGLGAPALGALLTVVSVFFAASFRARRRRIHDSLPDSYVKLMRPRPMFEQWPVLVYLHVLIFIAFIWLLVDRSRAWTPLWVGAGAVGLLIIVVYGISADSRASGRGTKAKDG